jgi:hypothetical protein
MGGLVHSRTLATHLIWGMTGLWRATIVIHRSRVRTWTVALRRGRIIWILSLWQDRPQRLAMRAVQYRLAWRSVHGPSIWMLWYPTCVSKVWICCVRWYKRVRLRRHWGENTFLMKADAIGTAPIRRRVESVTSNLPLISSPAGSTHSGSAHLTPSTIPAGDCGALPRCRLTEVHLSVLRIAVGVVRIGRIRYMLRMSLVHVVGRMAVEVLLLLRLRWR